jgi:hypothetical protein
MQTKRKSNANQTQTKRKPFRNLHGHRNLGRHASQLQVKRKSNANQMQIKLQMKRKPFLQVKSRENPGPGPAANRPVGSGTGTSSACRPVPARDPLPSTDSAVAAWPTLFVRFAGTRSSDSSKTFTPDVRLDAFTGRPSPVTGEGVVEVSRFAHMEFPRVLRVIDSAALFDGSRLTPSNMLPSPHCDQDTMPGR